MSIPLSAITRLEQAIVDQVIKSSEIPPNVLVQRLADSIDNSGVITNSTTITVRYTGMSSSLKNRAPLVTENTISFEVEVQAQQYFTHHGHDHVLRLITAVKNCLTNFMPMNTGIALEHPLNFTSESFRGITENTEFVYALNFNTVAQFTWPLVAADACVQRGIGSQSWPPTNVVFKLPPRMVLDPVTRQIISIPPDFHDDCILVQRDPPVVQDTVTGETGPGELTGQILLDYGLRIYRSPSDQAGTGELVAEFSLDETGWNYVRLEEPAVTYLDPLKGEIWKTYSAGRVARVSPDTFLSIGQRNFVLSKFEDSPRVWTLLT